MTHELAGGGQVALPQQTTYKQAVGELISNNQRRLFFFFFFFPGSSSTGWVPYVESKGKGALEVSPKREETCCQVIGAWLRFSFHK